MQVGHCSDGNGSHDKRHNPCKWSNANEDLLVPYCRHSNKRQANDQGSAGGKEALKSHVSHAGGNQTVGAGT